MADHDPSPPALDEHTSPLQGVRVLDLSRVMSGPFAGRLLADLGADVVKLEPPDGDLLRKFGAMRRGRSGFYTQQNAGKRNVCVDLRVDGAAAVVADLAAVADVLIENFRPGTMARYGLDYATLSARNPRLVMLSVTGFGQDGPNADRMVYAPVIHAEAGLIERQASFDGFFTDPIMSIADSTSALHALSGILAALLHRQRTGRGQFIDLSMFDAMLATDDYNHNAVDEHPITRLGGEVWEVTGGPLLVASDSAGLWQRLVGAFGMKDGLAPDATREAKVERRRSLMSDWLRSFATRDELKAALEKLGVGWGEVRTMADAVRSPAAVHRGTVVEVDDGDGETRPIVQSPWRFSGAAVGVRGRAPGLGEHNAEVLAEWAGYDRDRIAVLAESGALYAGEPRPGPSGPAARPGAGDQGQSGARD